MPEMMTYRVVKDEITPFLKKFPGKTRKAIGDGLFKIAKRAQGNLRRELSRQHLTDTFRLWRGIEGRRASNIRSKVFIPLYGVQLDSMKPHYVSLKRGRSVTKWTQRHVPLKTTHGKSRIYTGPRGGVKGALYVVPHPWIKHPLDMTAKQSLNIMNKELTKAVK